MLAITERSNPMTEDIDVAIPEDIVKILSQCDSEIFNGWQGQEALLGTEILRKIVAIAQRVQTTVQNAKQCSVILSGCGTSGRLAFMVARSLSKAQASSNDGNRPNVSFKYLIAGEDKALFTSQEAPEDDPRAGEKMLREASEGSDRVVFIGITCGLSAPYVAGQMQYCMEHLDVFLPVLIGFNPTSMARNIAVENWDQTFLSVVQRLERIAADGEGFILNPIVGPEPITGSSRMKGGSATKILLETILTLAMHPAAVELQQAKVYVRRYDAVRQIIYQHQEDIAGIANLAGHSLSSGGHVYYLGGDSLGIVGLIDASECPPTYGASFDDVRGFIVGGFKALQNAQGDMSHLGPHFRISWDNFETDVLPHVTENDLVILFQYDSDQTVCGELVQSKAKKALVHFKTSSSVKQKQQQLDTVGLFCEVNMEIIDLVQAVVPSPCPADDDFCGRFYIEIAAKWICNAISTIAHIKKGTVYKNIMIDVKPSNSKLFHRATGIIARVAGCSQDEARTYLLRSIYSTDTLTEDQLQAAISDHIEEAGGKEKVVPTALMCAISKMGVVEAQNALRNSPVIRNAIVSCLRQKQGDE